MDCSVLWSVLQQYVARTVATSVSTRTLDIENVVRFASSHVHRIDVERSSNPNRP